jgi:hypothetical protein
MGTWLDETWIVEAFIEHYNHRRTLHSPGHG